MRHIIWPTLSSKLLVTGYVNKHLGILHASVIYDHCDVRTKTCQLFAMSEIMAQSVQYMQSDHRQK